jgi:hypothetical protein
MASYADFALRNVDSLADFGGVVSMKVRTGNRFTVKSVEPDRLALTSCCAPVLTKLRWVHSGRWPPRAK